MDNLRDNDLGWGEHFSNGYGVSGLRKCATNKQQGFIMQQVYHKQSLLSPSLWVRCFHCRSIAFKAAMRVRETTPKRASLSLSAPSGDCLGIMTRHENLKERFIGHL